MKRPEILVVDDNPVIRTLLANVLGRAGFGVRCVGSGNEAVALYQEHGETLDLVMLDIQLGAGPDGPETFALLRALDAEVRCCFISADPGHYSIPQLEALGGLAFFSKPFPDLNLFVQQLRCLVQPVPVRRSA